MRRPITIFCCALVMITSFAGTAPGKTKTADFDFAKTKAFMKEMDGRPDFPVGMVLANDYVYALRALGDKIDAGRQNALIAWIKLTQQKNGGFALDRTSKETSLLYTDLALETLAYLKASDAVDTARIKAFAASLRNPDGGYGFSPEARSSSLANTFFAVRILKRVKGLDLVDKTRVTAYVKGYQKREGGFGYVKGNGMADAKSTYMASYLLNTLGTMDDTTRNDTLKFLAKTPYATGKKGAEHPTLDEQLHAVVALKELNATNRVDRAFALAFLRRLYIGVNGGFGPIEGYGSTPDSTNTALRVLAEIGMLKAPTGPLPKDLKKGGGVMK